MTEATWGDADAPTDIDWRMSAALRNVARGDSEIPEVTSLESAVRAWMELSDALQANAVLTPERPVRLHDGVGIDSFTGQAIRDLAELLPG